MKMMDQILVVDSYTYLINHINNSLTLRLISFILIRIIRKLTNILIRSLREVNRRVLKLFSGRFIRLIFDSLTHTISINIL